MSLLVRWQCQQFYIYGMQYMPKLAITNICNTVINWPDTH